MINEAAVIQLRVLALMQRDGVVYQYWLKPVEGLEKIVSRYEIIVSECDQIIKELE